MSEPKFERKLSPEDKRQLARADALFDRLTPQQMRDAAEYLLLGIAQARPTNQTMTEWLDKLEYWMRR